jgi:hypothetical protein
MPYKNQADANAAARRRWKESPEARRQQKAATQKWKGENKEHWNDYRNKWMKTDRDENLEVRRAYEFAREMKKYGTTVEWYRDLLIKQSGLCAICGHLSHHHGTLQRLQVDHNHDCCDIKTKSCGKCLRGLICADCNLLLSYFERFMKEVTSVVPKWDTWLENAIQYLRHYERLR